MTWQVACGLWAVCLVTPVLVDVSSSRLLRKKVVLNVQVP
jgi:hypothetical protein